MLIFEEFPKCMSSRIARAGSKLPLVSERPFRYTGRMIQTELLLPPSCETALLERFLKAEAMALWAVRAAKGKNVPPGVRSFLLRHEEEEARHLKEFETRLGVQSHARTKLPRMPNQWWALVIHLFGYETLGLEFAKLLVQVQPELTSILDDEHVHVDFFEHEVKKILEGGGAPAEGARDSARAWWCRLPHTVDRYLEGAALEPFKRELRRRISAAIRMRFDGLGLLNRATL
jgi:hypothetical protein